MAQPARLQQQAGRWALVDGIPFQMPVYCRNSPALFAPLIAAHVSRAVPAGISRHSMSYSKASRTGITDWAAV